MIWRWLDIAAGVLFLLDALGLATFVALYAWRSDWRATPAGRVLLGFVSILVAIMATAIVLGLIESPEHLRIVLRVILYGLLLGGVVHLIVLLLRSQRWDDGSHDRD